MDADASLVGLRDKVREHIAAFRMPSLAEGRLIGDAGGIPGAPSTINLNEEVAYVELFRDLKQGCDACDVIQDALGAFGQDPHAPGRRSPSGALFWLGAFNRWENINGFDDNRLFAVGRAQGRAAARKKQTGASGQNGKTGANDGVSPLLKPPNPNRAARPLQTSFAI